MVTKGQNGKKIGRKILAIILFLFFLLSLIMALDKWKTGYDEVYATVTKTYVSHGKYSHHKAYNITWKAKDGSNVAEGNLFNKNGYKEGDRILIRVDKKDNKTRYNNLIPYVCIDIIMMILSILLLIGKRNEKGKEMDSENN